MYEILPADCLSVLPTLPRACASMIFADPPYNLGIDYGAGRSADRLPKGKFINWCAEWIDAASPVLVETGSLWLVINYENVARVACLLEDAGLHLRNWITWYETFGNACTTKFSRTSRPILYCTKNPKRFTFHADAVRVPSARQTKYNDKRANPRGKVMDDVWQIPRIAGTFRERIPGFPTQLPLELVSRAVRCTSNPGDLIIDPFCGSGTTGEAAIRMGRRFLGIEKNSEYAAAASKRLETIAGGQDVLEKRTAPTTLATPQHLQRLRELLNQLSDAEKRRLDIDKALAGVEGISDMSDERVAAGITLIEKHLAQATPA